MKTINKKITRVNYNNSNRSNSQIKYLVYHYVGGVSTARNNADYFYSTYRGASAHFFVDENEIWQVVEENDTAWSVGANSYKHWECRNSNSINIEMCCKKDRNGNWYIEDATIQNAIELGQYLIGKYGFDRNHVLRHYDVTGKNCPEPMVRNPQLWTNLLDRLFGSSSGSSTPSQPGTSTGGYLVTVTTAVLNVREQPTTNSSITTQVRKGEVYTIVAESGNWGKLKSGAGWICLDYTSRNGLSSSATPVSKTMQVTAKIGLNVRNVPGGSKVGALTKGTIVTVTAEQNGWSKIGEGQWVSSQYLSPVSGGSSSGSFSKGDTVRIKSSATNYVTGEKIPSWVKNKSYQIIQKESGKSLLGSIMSWVYDKDLTK